jgi:hypothetical protein
MLKPYLFISLLALNLISCKTHTGIVQAKDNPPPKAVEIDIGDKAGAKKFRILDNKVFVNNSITFSGVGKAYIFSSKDGFEKIFGYAQINTQSAAPIDFTKNRVLAIIGQATEYPTTLVVKSTDTSPDGEVIHVQANPEINKSTSTVVPHLLLEIPNSYGVKFIVFIDMKQIEVVDQN